MYHNLRVVWYLSLTPFSLALFPRVVAILFGLWNVLSLITLNVVCLVAGIIQMVAGFVVMALEAPCCFPCIEQVNTMADKVDSKPMFFRAGLYCAWVAPWDIPDTLFYSMYPNSNYITLLYLAWPFRPSLCASLWRVCLAVDLSLPLEPSTAWWR